MDEVTEYVDWKLYGITVDLLCNEIKNSGFKPDLIVYMSPDDALFGLILKSKLHIDAIISSDCDVDEEMACIPSSKVLFVYNYLNVDSAVELPTEPMDDEEFKTVALFYTPEFGHTLDFPGVELESYNKLVFPWQNDDL